MIPPKRSHEYTIPAEGNHCHVISPTANEIFNSTELTKGTLSQVLLQEKSTIDYSVEYQSAYAISKNTCGGGSFRYRLKLNLRGQE
jgi:hypothetical protein